MRYLAILLALGALSLPLGCTKAAPPPTEVSQDEEQQLKADQERVAEAERAHQQQQQGK